MAILGQGGIKMDSKQFSTQQLLEAQNELLSLNNKIPTVLAKINNALSSIIAIPNVKDIAEEKPDLMSYDDVVREFGINKKTLYQRACKGEIPTIKAEKRKTMFSRKELTEFFERQKLPAVTDILELHNNLKFN